METIQKKLRKQPLRYFRRLQQRLKTEREIRELEREFRFCQKEQRPVEWVLLQKQLGKKYKELMESVKPP